ncbi:MAG TPA: inosine/xanthosine triphosphatase [Symbiobacteriaceae bacterium]|nr:inosine/xanthosine triphosphatase [Symbiobacteriaceae bacterium]
MERVAVGSTNPVKIGSARRIFAELFGEVSVSGVAVPSGVSNQPIGEEETVRGALNRARAALEATGCDWGVGLEGGVDFEHDGSCWNIQYCVVVHRDGRTSIGKGGRFLLPPVIAEGIRAGGEVGPLIDRLTGQTDSKKKGGAIGFLTNGLVVREELYAQIVAAAMVRFLHPELYDV